jgi:predicted aspartyl protease
LYVQCCPQCAVVLARHGHLAADRCTPTKRQALIDTGALHVVVPRFVAEPLGLLPMGWMETTMANGLLVEAEVTEGVYVELLHRQTLVHALIVGETVLIGALVLEGLDLAVDCLRGQLMPNLGTIDQPVFRV